MFHRTIAVRAVGACLALALAVFACSGETNIDSRDNSAPDPTFPVDPQGGDPPATDAAQSSAEAGLDAGAAPETSATCPVCPVVDAAPSAPPPADAGPASVLGFTEPPWFFADAGAYAGRGIHWVAWGDSITAGYGLGTPTDAYPTRAAARLGSNVHVQGLGRPGWTSHEILDAAVGELHTLAQPGSLQVASLLAGVNDWVKDAATPATDTEENLRTWVDAAHAAGWVAVLCTIPYRDPTPARATPYAIINAWIRSGASGADAVCDFDDPRMGSAWIAPNDRHPDADGHSWMAERFARAAGPVLADAGAR